MHEAIYEDSEGRSILVIELLDAYGMVNKASQPTGFVDSKLNPIQRPFVGLTIKDIREIAPLWFEQEKHECSLKEFVELIEAMLRLKNQ
jgi:hypothetical protein